MKDIQFLTERKYQHWASWDVVYEWEDTMSKVLECPVRPMWDGTFGQARRYTEKIYWKLRRRIRRPAAKFKTVPEKTWNLVWVMNAGIYQEYTFQNCIPLFMDFPVRMTGTVAEATKDLPVYWVTCYDIYERLKAAGSLNVRFFPLSISDRYLTGKVPDKTAGVIQAGRQDQKLHRFMLDYCRRHPDTEYISASWDHPERMEYVSTKRGSIGCIDSRRKYMKLLSSCKISLVSSPGAEGSSRFGNIDFITPRFYESAAQYCFMIGRYTPKKEAELTGLDRICPSVDSQKEFDRLLTDYLKRNAEENLTRYESFLRNNCTSRRAEEIKDELNSR